MVASKSTCDVRDRRFPCGPYLKWHKNNLDACVDSCLRVLFVPFSAGVIETVGSTDPLLFPDSLLR